MTNQLRAKYHRPRLKVHGVWAFGYTLSIYCMDDVARHNSSCIIEVVARTLQEATSKTFQKHDQEACLLTIFLRTNSGKIAKICVLSRGMIKPRQVFDICDKRGDPRPRCLCLIAAWT